MSSADHKSSNLTGLRREAPRSRNAPVIHPYFGKVDTGLARHLIEEFSHKGDTVLDPFCGSGVVLSEALVLGRSAIGWDSSPLATMLTTAKLSGANSVEQAQLLSILRELEQYGDVGPLFREDLPFFGKVPPMPRVRDVSTWFGPHALNELAFLKSYLSNASSSLLPASQLLARTAFSRIIVAASNQQGESSYRRVQKPDYPGRVIDLFVNSLKLVLDAATHFDQRMHKNGSARNELSFIPQSASISWEDLHCAVALHDTRSSDLPELVNGKRADLLVTSPPYLMSWDYGLYHKFRFYWLDFDLDAYEETEVGRHLRRKKDDVERYQSDMLDALSSMSRALNPGAHITLVNAPSIVYGKEVDTNAILAECGQEVGWEFISCTPTIDIPGPHHGMYASLNSRGAQAPGQRGKKEHVLIFRRNHS